MMRRPAVRHTEEEPDVMFEDMDERGSDKVPVFGSHKMSLSMSVMNDKEYTPKKFEPAHRKLNEDRKNTAPIPQRLSQSN